jgi:protein-S-isoprenylcysteine O-methyltransferase Ste14
MNDTQHTWSGQSGLVANHWPLATSLWRALARGYERLEATERGYVWLSKLGPAYLFGLVALLKGWGLSSTLQRASQGGDLQLLLLAGYQLSGLLFFGLVATLYVLRRRPLRRVQSPWHGLAALVGSYVMLPVALAGPQTNDAAIMAAADLMMIVGTAGAALALASLGRCFGIFPEARGLVTHGLYQYIRHPMYLFEFVAFLGVLLPAFGALNALLYSSFAAMQLARMTFEEQTLSATFPEEYPGYRQRTARLIPGVY